MKDETVTGRWHLHVTVKHVVWGVDPRIFEKDCLALGIRPVVVRNLMIDPGEEGYDELIAALHFEGTLAQAQHELVTMSCRMARCYWTPTRAKIKGSPEILGSSVNRADLPVCYWEAHLSVPKTDDSIRWLRRVSIQGWRPALSVSGDRLTATIRGDRNMVVTTLARLESELFGRVSVLKRRVEICVMDTKRELDDRWLGS